MWGILQGKVCNVLDVLQGKHWRGDDMREIKFRVWDKRHKGQMIYNVNIKNGSGWHWCAHCGMHYGHSSEDYIIMQYTGLQDKNGVKIFEGDIVVVGRGQIKYEREVYCANGNTYIDVPVMGCTSDMPMFLFGNDVKIIGNVFENPELIKGG